MEKSPKLDETIRTVKVGEGLSGQLIRTEKVGWGEKVSGRGVGRHPTRPLLAPGDEVVRTLRVLKVSPLTRLDRSRTLRFRASDGPSRSCLRLGSADRK